MGVIVNRDDEMVCEIDMVTYGKAKECFHAVIKAFKGIDPAANDVTLAIRALIAIEARAVTFKRPKKLKPENTGKVSDGKDIQPKA